MKKFILSAIAFLTLSTQAIAFVPQMSFYVSREVATARIWNTTAQPMICYGQAFGQTWQGVVLNSWVNGVVVYPNVSVDVYVHSNFYDPFVTVWANIDCRYGW